MSKTEKEAYLHYCCTSAGKALCVASNCMAWQWDRAPRLEFTQTLDASQVARIRKLESINLSEPGPFDAFMQESLADPSVLAVLHNVTDDLVCSDGPGYSSDDGVLFIRFTRADDRAATGYCGLVPPKVAP